MKSIYVYPAQLAVSAEPAEIRTILGSCVAVALFCPVSKVGGLNHFLLAESNDKNDRTLRYGATAIGALVKEMVSAGAIRGKLQAKVYGGAAVLQGVSVGSAIGARNVEFARAELGRLSIPILSEEVGGSRGRRLLLRSHTFEVEHALMEGRGSEPDTTGVTPPEVVKRVRVLIVDDSVTVRSIFSRVLASDPRISVVGIASDAYEARELLINQKPDVVLLDIEMPRMNGVVFLEKIMKHAPTPVIMVSSLGSHEEAAHRCLELGAVEFINKPSQFDSVILRNLAESLAQKCLAAASVPLRKMAPAPALATRPAARPSEARAQPTGFEPRSQVIVVGGNIGAQQGLCDLVAALPSDSPPVVATVSSVTAFLKPFLEKLQPRCQVRLTIASDGAVPVPGHVYFAPAEHHLTLDWISGGPYRVVVRKGLPLHSQVPSSGQLFASLAAQKRPLAGVVAILLSGFGDDGACELLGLRDLGAYCIVANPKTAPFAFLPGNAIRMGAADEVAEPGDMADLLLKARNRVVTN